jgi:hypothetical protein
MGAEQGARFAAPKPGTKPITNDHPCQCAECRPGPGLRYERKRTFGEILKAMGVDHVERHRCDGCRDTVWVVSVDMTTHWIHTCQPAGHEWRTPGRE